MKCLFNLFFIIIVASCSSDKYSDLDPEKLVYPLKTESVIHFNVMVDTSNPNISGNIGSNLSDKGQIILPKGYSPDGIPAKLVIYCHSGGGYVNDTFSESESSAYCQYLSSLGYAVLDMNGIPEKLATSLKIDRGRTVGNFIAVRSYVEGYEYVIENFNIDIRGCYVFANSNGGLICMNLANLNLIPIIAQAGVCPMISLENCLWNYKAGSIPSAGGEFISFQNRANIIRLFGMKEVNTQQELDKAIYEKNKVGDFDPFDYLINKVVNDYPCPFKIFQTKDDAAVNFLTTKKLVDAMHMRGDNLVLREFDSGGHTSEPQKGNVGVYKYQFTDSPLTPTVLEVAQWFELHDGYKVFF